MAGTKLMAMQYMGDLYKLQTDNGYKSMLDFLMFAVNNNYW